MICWDKNSGTPVHGHDGQKCWVYQLDGEIIEKRYTEDDEGCPVVISELVMGEGSLTYMDDKMGYHVLENCENNRAMTLHLYVAPIDECKIFNPDKQEFESVTLDYDTTTADVLLNFP